MKIRAFVLTLCLCLALCFASCAFASPVTVIGGDSKPIFEESEKLLKIYFINTHGASDAMVLTHAGQTMIIDCGDTNYGIRYVKPMLDELGISYVDYAYNTHPHDDHINGFISLMDEIKIGTFYTCFPMSYCKEQEDVMLAAMSHGTKIVPVDNESDISFGDISIWLYQDSKYLTVNPNRANSASMIMHISMGDSSVMITGDAEKPVFTDMYALKGEQIKADVIKMPHHGYNMPSYEVFGVIKPKYAVITNYYSEKIAESSQFLRNNSCPVAYTGRGTVELVTDGTRWSLRQITEY